MTGLKEAVLLGEIKRLKVESKNACSAAIAFGQSATRLRSERDAMRGRFEKLLGVMERIGTVDDFSICSRCGSTIGSEAGCSPDDCDGALARSVLAELKAATNGR